MKKRSFLIVFASVAVLVAASFLISGYKKKEPEKKALKQTVYYWYSTERLPYPYWYQWLGRKNTLADEKFLTGLNEGTYNPKTAQEYGFSPPNVTVDSIGYPIPNLGTPNIILYSHP